MIPAPKIEDNHYLRRVYIIMSTDTQALRDLADALDAAPEPPTFDGYTYGPWQVMTMPHYADTGERGARVEWTCIGYPNPEPAS